MSELLKIVNEIPIDEAKVKQIEEKYDCVLPEMVKHIVSYSGERRFVEEWRNLSLDEILNAKEDLHVDFIGKRLIPLIDTFDNDFIIFDLEHNKWVKMNIVDEIIFDEANDLEEFV